MGRPKKAENEKAKPNDLVRCDICHGFFTRGNRGHHEKTKIHQVYEKMNDNVRRLMFANKKQKFTADGSKIMNAEDLHVETAKANIRERLKSNSNV